MIGIYTKMMSIKHKSILSVMENITWEFMKKNNKLKSNIHLVAPQDR